MFKAAAERFRGPLHWWQALPVLTQDAGLAATFTVLGLLPPLAANGLRLGDLPLTGPAAGRVPGFGSVPAPGHPAALARAGSGPGACAFAAYQLLGYPRSFSSVGLLLALYAAGAYEASFRRELIAGATASYVVLAVALAGLGSTEQPIDYTVFYLALCACWGAGVFVRS